MTTVMSLLENSDTEISFLSIVKFDDFIKSAIILGRVLFLNRFSISFLLFLLTDSMGISLSATWVGVV